MALKVNLDALVPREDFEIESEGDGNEVTISQTIQVRDLERSTFFFAALRKPDFQRETAQWTPNRVSLLVQTFLSGDLIPAIILWKNKEFVFVIDGSHRLSALIAWVQDDYGDGEASLKFYNGRIPDEQQDAANKARGLVNKSIGSYEDHKKAISDPNNFSPETVKRARRLASLALQLQWVKGDSTKAEDSFIRINQQAAIITPQELELIKSRNMPSTIASRAIIRCGTGHRYWSRFNTEVQEQILSNAKVVYDVLFSPPVQYPLKTTELAAGGSAYAPTALRMVYDLVNLSVETPSNDEDLSGETTLSYLKRAKNIAELLISNAPKSLGLHPAIYFYSWTGKQQPVLLLVWADIMREKAKNKKLRDFSSIRSKLEDFLLKNRALTNQIVRKYGSKLSGETHLKKYFEFVISRLSESNNSGVLMDALKEEFPFLQPEEEPYSNSESGKKFSSSVRSGVFLREKMKSEIRCAICYGYVPAQACSIDHIQRRSEGGTALSSNAQITHPFCNTGVKS